MITKTITVEIPAGLEVRPVAVLGTDDIRTSCR